MPLTFAYGSNMDAQAMAQRCPRAKLLGPARLPKFCFALLPDGFATLARDPGAFVHGVLWELSFGDLAALDRYEGVAQGAYEKFVLPVLREKGAAVRALVYLGRSNASQGRANASQGRAPADYMEKIIAAAEFHGLPRDHVETLRALAGLPPEAAPPKFRAIRNAEKLT